MQVGILNLGFSNISSIVKAISTLGYESKIIEKTDSFFNVDKLIFPGVGHFQYAMQALSDSGLRDLIVEHCQANKALLGICLGMQLLFEQGDEGGDDCPGLGLIPGRVEKISSKHENEKIPHNGWNEVNFSHEHEILWQNIENNKDFYFNHSYSVKTAPEFIIGTTPFGQGIVSAIRKHNMWGVQFHPEKSQSLGQKVLKNFLTAHD